MRTHPYPGEIRDLVISTFRELGVSIESALDVGETIRLDRGRYVARSYRVDGMMAMWLIDVGILQFYDAGGNMLLTVNLFTRLTPHRVAA